MKRRGTTLAATPLLAAAAVGVATLPDGQPTEVLALQDAPPRALTEQDLRCAPGQAVAAGIAEPDPGYVNGPDSARTPRAAIAQRIGWFNGALDGEDLTWQQVGPTREDNRPMKWERWAGLRWDGRIRAVFTVQGGQPGGGWLVTGTLLCTDAGGGRPY